MVLVNTKVFKQFALCNIVFISFMSYRQQSGHIGHNVRKPVESMEIRKVECESLCLLCRLYYLLTQQYITFLYMHSICLLFHICFLTLLIGKQVVISAVTQPYYQRSNHVGI